MATLSSKVTPSGVATAAQGTLADSAVQPNDSPTFDGLTVDTDTLFVDAANNRVGIGTTTPVSPLHVEGNGSLVRLKGSGGDYHGLALQCSDASGTATKNIFIDTLNENGASVANMVGQVQSDGGSNWSWSTQSAGARTDRRQERLRIDASGRVYLVQSASRGYSGYPITTPNDTIASALRANGYIEWQTDIGAIGTSYFVSDERKKDNIVPATKQSSEVIEAIQFIEFDWKPDSGGEGHVDVGVSAQQLQTIDPRLVSTLSDDMLMVNEPALVSHMAKALQEALTKIEALEARLVALESV